MTMSEAVTKRTEEYLAERGWTIYRLSRESLLPVSTLRNLYSGHTNSPTLSVVFRIAETFGVSASEFLNSPCFYPENLELE